MKNIFKHKSMSGIFRVSLFLITAGILLMNPSRVNADNTLPVITVYKTATCGCCKGWVQHLEKNGFVVQSTNLNNLLSIKEESGIEAKFRSCHTAKVGNYVVEGHVPSEDIKKMLSDMPKINGLAVPGMPMGSPGMEGSRKDKYNVLAIKNDGNHVVYNSH